MALFTFIIIIVIIVLFFKAWQTQERKTVQSEYPFRKNEYLLSIAEKKFYDVLKPIAENHNAIVLIKVRLEDLLWTPPQHRNLRNLIKSRHIDFVLCGKEKINPICAIELNDASHKRFDRIVRDERMVKILSSAKLPFLQVIAKSFYDPTILTQEIEEKISTN